MSATQYIYTPFNPAENEFRLLRLLPSTSGSLVGELTTHTLDKEDGVQYKAVSYVWGSSEQSKAILINGRRLPLTRNAFQMLENLRDEKLYLWIDAVCINQSDNVERSHQVQKMRDIYSLAERVIFYLGTSTPDTDILFWGLSLLDRMIGDNSSYQEVSRTEHNGLIASDWNCVVAEIGRFSLRVRERQRQGLRDILARNWFRRVWVVQEVALARDGEVRCGQKIVSSRAFGLATRVLQVKAVEHCRVILSYMPWAERTATSTRWEEASGMIPNGVGRDLYDTLNKHRHAEATNKRDNIYGLLGLCTAAIDNSIKVDYNKSFTDIVREVIAYICCCDIGLVPVTFAGTMRSFKKILPQLDQTLFVTLLQSTADGVVIAIASILKHRRQYVRIDTQEMGLAARNTRYKSELLELLMPKQADDYLPMSSLTVALDNSERPPGETILSDISWRLDLDYCWLMAAVLHGTEGVSVIESLLDGAASHVQPIQEAVLRAPLRDKRRWREFLQRMDDWLSNHVDNYFPG